MLLSITDTMVTVFFCHQESASRVPAMPAYPLHEIVPDDPVGLFHCIVRCVHRAFLCGDDPLIGKNHDHRPEWIRLRLQQLAAVFGIDICGYPVTTK
jgi:hypothetical protein